ncbi:hypothetical protein [Chitinilyticum litopenaei]|uniref:hypothetical protein n=1 Tax=Chitinilyticum litopenaei TaxID=1121276 RepID=UPI0003FCC51B|nr:hypothetical protein [Chitinilyticum litopenaei]
MAMNLYLQQFRNGQLHSVCKRTLLDTLGPFGQWHDGGEIGEFRFAGNDIASSALIASSAEGDCHCLSFLHPQFGDPLRKLVFELLDKLNCFVFDDELGTLYHVHGELGDLPARMRGKLCGQQQRIRSPQQLWPEGTFLPPASRPKVKLAFQHPERKTRSELLLDAQNSNGAYTLPIALCHAAGNPGTLSIQQELVNAVNCVTVQHELKTAIDFDSMAALMDTIMTVKAPADSEDPAPAAFVANAETHRTARRLSEQFRQQVLQKFNLQLELSAGSLPQLEQLLEKIHQLYLQERTARPSEWHSKAAANWARLAGAWLGEVLRAELGAQWGTLQRGGIGWNVLMLNSQQGHCWPEQQVLNRIIGGKQFDLQHSFQQHWLPQKARSAGARDLAGRISDYADQLVAGLGEIQGIERLARAKLDFTPESLRELDRFLCTFAGHDLDDLMTRGELLRSTGAYVGEVLRRNSAQHWLWMNYDEYMALRAPQDTPADERLPDNPAFAAMLVREDDLLALPFNYVLGVLLEPSDTIHSTISRKLQAPLYRESKTKPYAEKITVTPQYTPPAGKQELALEPQATPAARELALEPESGSSTAAQSAADHRSESAQQLLVTAPGLVLVYIGLADGKADAKETQAFLSEVQGLAKLDNFFGRLIALNLETMASNQAAYFGMILGILEKIDASFEAASLTLLSAAADVLDAELGDEMQSRYVRRRLYNLGATVAAASGGGFLRSAVSREEQARLDRLKQALRC